ncbi:MAG: YihA family ribosome biogenesis GTP-binding protein [Lachnospiraceae bacterium]|nr:YihA family ribosome biogenesis GTP-binding protein [Lachnospiraceae bacterium]
MVIKQVNLETVCGVTSTFPKNTKMEVAFAGKSNVGKSSLINALMNRKNYARTSAQPGKTQTINYYNINDEFYLVDLPGYGFTKAAVNARMQWGRMIERYLKTSEMLYAVFLLVDIRHTPNANDKQMYDWMVDSGYHPIVIATKSDKIKRSQLQARIKDIRQGLEAEDNVMVIPFSAESKQGRDEIYDLLDDMLVHFNED